MVVDGQAPRNFLASLSTRIFWLDLRSLAAFRIGLATIILVDLFTRFQDLTAHYTDAGVLPLNLWKDISFPGRWSIHALSGHPGFEAVLFAIACLMALAMLVGYHTRLATIASWALLVSLHNRNPVLIFAGDDVLRALMFWAMFLPLGARYSIDNAMNTAARSLPERVVSGAAFALMVQQCFIYIFSAAIKTKSAIWTGGDAVYYALSYDQYVTPLGQFLLNFPPLLKLSNHITLVIEWIGPLAIFSPFRNSLFRLGAVITFVLLHLGFGLTLNIGVFPFLSSFSWLAFLPSSFWNSLGKRLQTPERQGLKIYYDSGCGFCKKVVHLIRTFLILPDTPLLMAQDDPEIHADMERYNSWVVVDWQGNRHFKFAGIIYVVSLSPILGYLAPILSWKPIFVAGTKFYETIANNRRAAGRFTRPLKFREITIKPSRPLNILALGLLFYAFLWNISSYNPNWFKRRVWQKTEFLGRMTRLDQSWSIFAPNPPRDDGWHVIPGRLQDGSEVDIFRDGQPVSWEKPTLGERARLYRNMQWRTYFINLNRGFGKVLYPYYAKYLCRRWNDRHSGAQRMDRLEVYFMDERTVPPGEPQTVQKTKTWEQSCSE